MRSFDKEVAMAVISGRKERMATAVSRGCAVVARSAIAKRLGEENLALRLRWARARAALLALRAAPAAGVRQESFDTSDSESTGHTVSDSTTSRKDMGELFETPLYPCLDAASIECSSEETWASTWDILTSAVKEGGDAYAAAFKASYRWLLADTGPLSQSLRFNLAIMGAAESGSRLAAGELADAWESVGGTHEWLRRPSSSPATAFSQLSAALNARPPQISAHHFRDLERIGWSAADLLHAMLIFAHFQALPILHLANNGNFTISEEEYWAEENEDDDIWEPIPVTLSSEEYTWEDAESLLDALLLEGSKVLELRRRLTPHSPAITNSVFALYGYRSTKVLSGNDVGGCVGGGEIRVPQRLFRRAVICPSSVTAAEVDRLRSLFSPSDWVTAWESRVEVAVVYGCKALAESLLVHAAQ